MGMLINPSRFSAGGGGAPTTVVTWNPSDKGPNITLSAGNLTATSATTTSYSSVRATQGYSSGKHYFEVHFDATTVSNFNMIGVATAGPSMTSGFHVDGDSAGYYEQTGQAYRGNVPKTYGASYTAGDVIGVALDASAGTIEFFKNGTSQGIAYTGMSTLATYYPAIALYGRATNPNPVMTGRFKTADFSFSPPTGYFPWGI